MKALIASTLFCLALPTAFAQTAQKPIDFMVKFDRQDKGQKGAPFKDGEVVEAPVFIRIKENKAEFLVDLNDTRHSDIFKVDLTPENRAQIQFLIGIPSAGVFKIRGEGKYLVSNMFEYSAELISLRKNAELNPTLERLQQIPRGTRVALKGHIGEISYNEKKIDGNFLNLTTDDGKEYELNLLSGIPKIEENLDRAIENVENKLIATDDEVIVHAMSLGEGRVGVHWTRSMYLTKASPQRQSEFDTMREGLKTEIAKMSAALAEKNFAQARKHFSLVVKHEPTKAELAQIESLNKSMPEKEQALRFPDRMVIDNLHRTFAVDFDSMTREGFFAFLEAYIKFQVPYAKDVKRSGDETYISRLFKTVGVTKVQEIEFTKRIVENHIERIQYLKDSGQMNQWNWNSQYAMGQWMNHLVYIENPNKELLEWALQISREVTALLKDYKPAASYDEYKESLRNLLNYANRAVRNYNEILSPKKQ